MSIDVDEDEEEEAVGDSKKEEGLSAAEAEESAPEESGV